MEVIKQGARARTFGRPRDACPYPGDSRERRAWYEGYDGAAWNSAWDLGTRVPHPAAAHRAGTATVETAAAVSPVVSRI
ncbi:Rmf/CrpP family protein [Methylobacterium sp. WL2]|nr:Rmf/CrpP family protein [Methylobacterium sp. WL2]